MMAELREVRSSVREGHARFLRPSEACLGDTKPMCVERDEGAQAASRLWHTSKHGTQASTIVDRGSKVSGRGEKPTEGDAAPVFGVIGVALVHGPLIASRVVHHRPWERVGEPGLEGG